MRHRIGPSMTTESQWLRRRIDSQRNCSTLQRLSLACGGFRRTRIVHEQRRQSEHESINCAQGRGASTGAAADSQVVLEQRRFCDDGANAAGARKHGQGAEQLCRKRSKSRIVRSGYQSYRSAQNCPYAGSHAIMANSHPTGARVQIAQKRSRADFADLLLGYELL